MQDIWQLISLNPRLSESLGLNKTTQSCDFSQGSARSPSKSYSTLKENFNTHLFIIKLKEVIKSDTRQSLSYGSVVRWIQDNTTTVPTPRSWELKQEQIVNILYEWICFFDTDYTWKRPSHSQVIYYIGNS